MSAGEADEQGLESHVPTWGKEILDTIQAGAMIPPDVSPPR